jgi:hypothetical protein
MPVMEYLRFGEELVSQLWEISASRNGPPSRHNPYTFTPPALLCRRFRDDFENADHAKFTQEVFHSLRAF